jgi:hypothetical protein
MKKKIATAVAALERAKEGVEEVILEEIGRLALKHKLTEIIFYAYTTCYRGEEAVETPADIEKVEDIYLKHVNDNGFIARWTKESGWGVK